MNKHESLGAVHTHTHNTFMEKESKNRKPMQWWNPSTRQRATLYLAWKNLVCNNIIVKKNDIGNFDRIENIINQAYGMGLVCDVKRMDYNAKQKVTMKRIKLLQDSLSFL